MNTATQTMTSSLLVGRLAFITGAGQGNGRALAIGLAQAGARVIATDVQQAAAVETATLITAQGGQAWAYGLDVCDEQACQAIAERVAADVGQVSVLINNAGIIIRSGMTAPHAAKHWRDTMDVNVQGTFNVTHAFLPAIRATKGNILNIASIAAYAGQGGSVGYSPSKGAIKMFTQALAAELAPEGVRVNALAPGVINTPMTAATQSHPERLASFMTRIPMGRLGEPDELVGPTVFLVSDMAAYVTGVTLAVDGGFLAV